MGFWVNFGMAQNEKNQLYGWPEVCYLRQSQNCLILRLEGRSVTITAESWIASYGCGSVMVPGKGIEPLTRCLQGSRSATELDRLNLFMCGVRSTYNGLCVEVVVMTGTDFRL